MSGAQRGLPVGHCAKAAVHPRHQLPQEPKQCQTLKAVRYYCSFIQTLTSWQCCTSRLEPCCPNPKRFCSRGCVPALSSCTGPALPACTEEEEEEEGGLYCRSATRPRGDFECLVHDRHRCLWEESTLTYGQTTTGKRNPHGGWSWEEAKTLLHRVMLCRQPSSLTGRKQMKEKERETHTHRQTDRAEEGFN